ncbi:hypothetical protein AOLI_G00099190 [Acnodon oligacanthus]
MGKHHMPALRATRSFHSLMAAGGRSRMKWRRGKSAWRSEERTTHRLEESRREQEPLLTPHSLGRNPNCMRLIVFRYLRMLALSYASAPNGGLKILR